MNYQPVGGVAIIIACGAIVIICGLCGFLYTPYRAGPRGIERYRWLVFSVFMIAAFVMLFVVVGRAAGIR